MSHVTEVYVCQAFFLNVVEMFTAAVHLGRIQLTSVLAQTKLYVQSNIKRQTTVTPRATHTR